MDHYLDDVNKGFMEPRPANYVPLTPLSFLTRIASIYPKKHAVIYGKRKYSWSEVYERSVRLASAIVNAGVKPGEVVTIMAPNIPEMFEAHYGVAMAGAVLNTLNTRLDTDTIAYILDHADTRLLITDAAFGDAMKTALAQTKNKNIKIIDIVDEQAAESASGVRLGDQDYESFWADADPEFNWQMPTDEWQAMCLNYTSGTSGRPKV